jgi:hypothetical protein
MGLALIGRKGHGEMPQELDPQANPTRPMAYQIRITGQIDPRWADSFEGLTITLDGGDTLITGPVVDQAAPQGLLKRVRDLGMPLVSVNPVEPGPPSKPRGTGDGRAWGQARQPQRAEVTVHPFPLGSMAALVDPSPLSL